MTWSGPDFILLKLSRVSGGRALGGLGPKPVKYLKGHRNG